MADEGKKGGGFEPVSTKIELKGKPTGLSMISKKAKIGVAVIILLVLAGLVTATVMNWKSGPNDDASAANAGSADTDQTKPTAMGKEFKKTTDDEFKGISDGSAAMSQLFSASSVGDQPFVGGPSSESVPGINGAKPQDLHGVGPGQKAAVVGLGEPGGEKEPPAGRNLDFDSSKNFGGSNAAGQHSGSSGDAGKGGGEVKFGRGEHGGDNPVSDLMGGDPSTKISAAIDKQAALLSRANGAGLALQQNALQDDPNKQLQKESFASGGDGGADKTNLPELRRAPASRYTIVAGSVLPMVLGCGINSDLPNQVCATVSQDVYDSATGSCLLVPQGTKALGTVNSQVALGQSRIQTSWTRLDFADTSSMNLRGMPGDDAGGAAGFDANVDNHYGKVVLIAGIASIFSAGLQLSQPQQSSNGGAPSTGQLIAGSAGQQISQIGVQTAQRQLQVQPTLTQVQGYPFTITLTSTLVFDRPYRVCRD